MEYAWKTSTSIFGAIYSGKNICQNMDMTFFHRESNASILPFVTAYHIVAVATQECQKSIEKSIVFPSKEIWVKRLKSLLSSQYVLLKTETMAAIHIAVFVSKSISNYVDRK